MKNKSLKFLAVLVLAFMVMNVALGLLLKNEMSHIKYGIVGDVNKTMESKAEVLILGSSRAKHHYQTEVLADYFQTSAYNMGVNGQGIEFANAMLKTYLDQHDLERLILDISPNVFIPAVNESKLMSLLPLIDIYPHFKGMFPESDPAVEIADYVNLAKYNSTIYNIVRDRVPGSKKIINGYEALNGFISQTCDSTSFPINAGDSINSRKWEFLQELVSLCDEKGVKLNIVISPIYCRTPDVELLTSAIDKLEGDFQFYNYASSTPLSGNPNLFKDFYHLNGEGAQAYTKLFVKNLKL